MDTVIRSFPPVVLALILAAVLAALVIFIVGFSKHGVNFLKYGFTQGDIIDLGKKIDDLRTEFKTALGTMAAEFKNDLGGMATRDDLSRLDVKIAGMATKDDLSRLDAKIAGMATKDDLSRLDVKIAGMATRDDMSRLDAKIVAIETNHFGHLKNFLTELTSILLDKGVINNTDKARLDNELRGM